MDEDLPRVLALEPEPVRLPQPLELLLDDGGEERARISIQGRLQHPADVDVDVVDVLLVRLLQLTKQKFMYLVWEKGVSVYFPELLNNGTRVGGGISQR